MACKYGPRYENGKCPPNPEVVRVREEKRRYREKLRLEREANKWKKSATSVAAAIANWHPSGQFRGADYDWYVAHGVPESRLKAALKKLGWPIPWEKVSVGLFG